MPIVPERTSLAVVLRDNDYLSPFFGESLGRRVVLVPPGNGDALGGADWLVTAPRTGADQCPDDWRERFGVGDWKVLERVGRGGCGT